MTCLFLQIFCVNYLVSQHHLRCHCYIALNVMAASLCKSKNEFFSVTIVKVIISSEKLLRYLIPVLEKDCIPSAEEQWQLNTSFILYKFLVTEISGKIETCWGLGWVMRSETTHKELWCQGRRWLLWELQGGDLGRSVHWATSAWPEGTLVVPTVLD